MPTTATFSFHARLNPALDDDFDSEALWEDFLSDVPHVNEPGNGTLLWADRTMPVPASVAHGMTA